VTACFERVYGRSYVARFFYDPEAIRMRMADGRLVPVVAVSSGGEVAGHMALTQSHRGARTAEAGNTAVDPRFRGHGLAARLGAALIEECRGRGFVGFHHYPTTAHPIMQKLAVQGGGVETGVMLDYIPAGTDYRELEVAADGRLAVVVVYQPILAAPARTVFVPGRYQQALRGIYERAGLERVFGTGTTANEEVTAAISYDVARRLRRIEVLVPGTGLDRTLEETMAAAPAEVTHADLPLGHAATPAAIDTLLRYGFVYCCVLPELRADGDVLRMQRLPHPLARGTGPELVHSHARELHALALRDSGREP